MNFILSTGSLYTYSISRCFAFARQAGFDGIELLIDHRWDTRQAPYIQQLIEQHALPVRAVHAPFLINLRGWAADNVDSLQRSIELAESVGAAVVVHHLPPRFSYTIVQAGGNRLILPLPWRRRHQQEIQWLQTGYRALQDTTDVLLCIENLPATRILGRRINSAQWNAHSRETVGDITRFPHITLDTTHLGTWGLDPVEIYVRWGARVKHVHLSNFDGQEHRRPEQGRLPLDRLLARMAAAGYQHSISLELHPDALEAGSADQHVVRLLRDSLAWCRRAAEQTVARQGARP